MKQRIPGQTSQKSTGSANKFEAGSENPDLEKAKQSIKKSRDQSSKC